MKWKISTTGKMDVRDFFSICFGNDRRPLLGSSYNEHKSQGLMGINIVEINNALNKTLKHVNTFLSILGHL